MGFFSKIFKGVKKVFKKIGKGIKKNVRRFGKFMDKIGIVGQIAMSFILPGIGGALLKGLGGALGKVGAWAATTGGNALIQGAKAVIGTATKFITQGARVFNTVTSGIKNFASEITKTALNKIPGITIEGASKTFFGTDGSIFGANGALGKAATATGKTWNSTIGSKAWMNKFDPSYQRLETAVSKPMLKPDNMMDDPFADSFDPTRKAAPSFGDSMDLGEFPALVELPPEGLITGGDSLLAQKSTGLGVPVNAPSTVTPTDYFETMYGPNPNAATSAATTSTSPRELFTYKAPAFWDAAANPNLVPVPPKSLKTLDQMTQEVLDYDFGLEPSGGLTGKAVTGALGEGAKQVAKTAITDYLTPDESAPRPYAEVVNLGQMSVAESQALDYGSGFGFNRMQQDYLRSMPTYVPRNTWQTRMMS